MISVTITILNREDGSAKVTIPAHDKPIEIEVLEGGIDKLLFKESLEKRSRQDGYIK